MRKGGRSGAGHSREHYGDRLPIAHAPPLVPGERRRSLGLPVLRESSQVRSWQGLLRTCCRGHATCISLQTGPCRGQLLKCLLWLLGPTRRPAELWASHHSACAGDLCTDVPVQLTFPRCMSSLLKSVAHFGRAGGLAGSLAPQHCAAGRSRLEAADVSTPVAAAAGAAQHRQS